MAEITQRKKDFNRYWALKSEYESKFKPTHQDITDYIYPQGARFDEDSNPNDGERRDDKIVNSAASVEHRTLTSILWSAVTSPAMRWLRLSIDDESLKENAEVKRYFDQVTDIMLASFRKSNFYTAIKLIYAASSAYGTGAIQMEADTETVFRFTPFVLGRYYIDTDMNDRVDYIARVIPMRARNVIEKFGIDNVSQNVKNLVAGDKTGEEYVNLLHIQERNVNRDVNRLDSKNKLYRSVYYEHDGPDDMGPLRESGFDTKPFSAFRWDKVGDNTWGRGPGEDALPETKLLQTYESDSSRALAKELAPPQVALGSAGNLDINTAADGITYVDGITQGQQPALSPAYQITAPIEKIDAKIESKKRDIARIFYTDLLLLLSSAPREDKTATQVMIEVQEQLKLLGPIVEQFIPEGFEPIISRGYDILNKMGRLPIPPDIIQGKEVKVDIISLVSQAQEMTSLAPIEQFYAFVRSMAETHPNVLYKYDAEQAADEYGSALGVKQGVIRSDDVVAAMKQADQQAAQEQQAMEQAGAVIEGAKTLSETELGNNALTAVAGA